MDLLHVRGRAGAPVVPVVLPPTARAALRYARRLLTHLRPPRPPRYLESLAIIPQLYMFQKQAGGVVEVLVSHFVSALGIARIVEMAFWISSWHELADSSGSKKVGLLVIVVQVIHVALMADFFYFYAISLKDGTAMKLPNAAAGIV